ncbi:MAG TPA: DUF3775 domain-containing protein [Stellaceae bacterium]|nr:DUF3775 domain-containing protein [Stellaceae bacterium]
MAQNSEAPVELNISPETVGFIIVKAREYDAKVEPDDPESGSNPADDLETDVLEDFPDDPTLEELSAAIDSLNDDETIDLIALAWVGRGDFGKEEWGEARRLAKERHRPHSSAYLVGMPTLGDYLEEGLAVLGYPVSELGAEHL